MPLRFEEYYKRSNEYSYRLNKITDDVSHGCFDVLIIVRINLGKIRLFRRSTRLFWLFMIMVLR